MKAKPGAHVAWREIDGETVLVDLRRSLMVAVNGSGGRLWRAIQEGADLDALAGELAPGAPEEGRGWRGSFWPSSKATGCWRRRAWRRGPRARPRARPSAPPGSSGRRTCRASSSRSASCGRQAEPGRAVPDLQAVLKGHGAGGELCVELAGVPSLITLGSRSLQGSIPASFPAFVTERSPRWRVEVEGADSTPTRPLRRRRWSTPETARSVSTAWG